MSGPVDVLAVMGRDAAHADAYRIVHGVLDATPQELASESEKARAAVAELIEAATEGVRSGCPCDACERIRAALARCRGAA